MHIKQNNAVLKQMSHKDYTKISVALNRKFDQWVITSYADNGTVSGMGYTGHDDRYVPFRYNIRFLPRPHNSRVSDF